MNTYDTYITIKLAAANVQRLHFKKNNNNLLLFPCISCFQPHQHLFTEISIEFVLCKGKESAVGEMVRLILKRNRLLCHRKKYCDNDCGCRGDGNSLNLCGFVLLSDSVHDE